MLGQDVAEEDEKSADGYESFWGKKKEEAEEKDTAEQVEFYDFRRGSKHWPRGAELISDERGKELIDAAVEEANKKEDKSKTAGKGDKKTGFGGAGGGGGGGGVGGDDDDGFGTERGDKGASGDKADDDKEGGEAGKKGMAIGPAPPPGAGWGGYMNSSSSDEEDRDPDEGAFISLNHMALTAS